MEPRNEVNSRRVTWVGDGSFIWQEVFEGGRTVSNCPINSCTMFCRGMPTPRQGKECMRWPSILRLRRREGEKEKQRELRGKKCQAKGGWWQRSQSLSKV